MCGIVGYITLTNETRVLSKEKFFKEALFADTLRGKDSTGIMQLTDDFRWSWVKHCISGDKFVKEKSFLAREVKAWCAVGHNRAATSGSIITDNAHPFMHEDIILVHNGTLRTTHNLPHVNHKLKVDSDLLTFNISQVEPHKAYEILGKIQGAYALVWFDTRDETVNFARNDERPMHFGVSSTDDMLMFASDGHLLNFCSQRLLDTSCQITNIWQIGTGQQLKFKKGSLIPEVIKVTPFTWPTPVYVTPTGGHGPGGYAEDWGHFGTDQSWHRGREPGHIHDIPRPAGRAAERGQIDLGGAHRIIPVAMTTMVEDWYHLQHDTELMFDAKNFQCWNTKDGTGAIYGRIWHPEWDTWFDAKVTGVTRHTMQMYKNSAWTVHPVGVAHHDGCEFLCKVKFYQWKGEMPGKVDSIEPAEATLLDIHGNEIKLTDDKNSYLSGPHGEITVEAWWTLCQKGCVMCGTDLFMTDHSDIVWVGEYGNQPLCEDCLDETREPTNGH